MRSVRSAACSRRLRLACGLACRYAQLAAHAQDIGRKALAAALLEKETCASEQARHALADACPAAAGGSARLSAPKAAASAGPCTGSARGPGCAGPGANDRQAQALSEPAPAAPHDPARLQVPLLLKLGEHERALTKAINAGDPDLVYLALFALQRLAQPARGGRAGSHRLQAPGTQPVQGLLRADGVPCCRGQCSGGHACPGSLVCRAGPAALGNSNGMLQGSCQAWSRSHARACCTMQGLLPGPLQACRAWLRSQNPEALEQTLLAQGAMQQCAELRFGHALQRDAAVSSQLQRGSGSGMGTPHALAMSTLSHTLQQAADAWSQASRPGRHEPPCAAQPRRGRERSAGPGPARSGLHKHMEPPHML